MKINLRTDASGGAVFVEASQTDQSVSGTQGCTLLTSPTNFTVVDTNATGGPVALSFTSPSLRSDTTADREVHGFALWSYADRIARN